MICNLEVLTSESLKMRGDRTLIIVWQVQTDVICSRDMKQKFPSPPWFSSSIFSSPVCYWGLSASRPQRLNLNLFPRRPPDSKQGELTALLSEDPLQINSAVRMVSTGTLAEWLLSWVLELNPDFPTCPVTLGSSFNFSLPPLPHLWSGYEWLCRLSEQIYINHMVE